MLSLDQQNDWRERYRIEHPGWRPATEVYAENVKMRLSPDSRLLDVGCGRGGLIEHLSIKSLGMVGVDPDFLSLSAHRLQNLPRAAAVSDRLPFAEEAFDIILAGWLLEHLRNPSATFAALERTLKKGGVLVFITPNGKHPLGWVNKVAGRLGRIQGQLVERLYARTEDDTFPTFYRANTPQTLIQLANHAGLSVEVMELIPDPTYIAFNDTFYHVMRAIDDHLPKDRRIHIVGVLRK